MTQPLCPGDGEPKPDTPPWLILTAAFIVELLVARIPWIGPFLGVLVSQAISAETYCKVLPPPMPTWGPEDVAQLVGGTSVLKLEQTIHNLVWHEYCQCSGAATPPLVAPAAPEPLPVLTPMPKAFCDHASYEIDNPFYFQGGIDVGTGKPINARQLPGGSTHVTIDAQTSIAAGDTGGWSWRVELTFFDLGGANVGGCVQLTGQSASSPNGTLTCSIPATSSEWVGRIVGTWFNTAPNRAFVQIGISCGGPPNQLQEECCPPDPTVIAQLNRMAAQLSDIQAAVGGIDELEVLSSQPLSGEGEALLPTGTRAVSIELLELGPDAFTSALGRPRGLMRVGSIRWGSGVGYSMRKFVDADRMDVLRPQGALSISWQLLPGTSGTLKFLG